MNDEMYRRPADPGQSRAACAGAGWPSSARTSARWRRAQSDRPGRMSEPETILAHACAPDPRTWPARRTPGRRHRRADPRSARPGARRHQSLQRQDGISHRRCGLAAGRGRRAHLGAGRARPSGGRHAAPGGKHQGSRRSGRGASSRTADVLVMAAAPADFRPSAPSDSKRRATMAHSRSRWSRPTTS